MNIALGHFKRRPVGSLFDDADKALAMFKTKRVSAGAADEMEHAEPPNLQEPPPEEEHGTWEDAAEVRTGLF